MMRILPPRGTLLSENCRSLFDDAALAVGDEVGEVGYVFACAAGGDGFADGGEGVGGVEF